MRRVSLFFLFCVLAFGQSREIVLCDNQSPRNCFSWDIGANLGSNLTITGPVVPTNGENSGAGRGTMTGHMLWAGGFGFAATIKLGSNIDAIPDTAGTFGAAQSANDCTIANVPVWNSGTTYNIGDIAQQGGLIYTSIVNSNLNHIPPNASFWVQGCTDDRTRVDWFGFEGDFFRIKAHGTGNTEIGDYFDWTRYGLTNALPVHQLNLNDSGFNTILHIDEDGNFVTTNFDYSGQIRFGLNSSLGVTAGIAQHTCTPTGTCGNGMLEVNTGTIGTLGQLTVLGLDVNQNNDNSGYQIQSNGGIEMTANDATHNILSKGTARNAIDTPSGGNHIGTALYLVNNGSTPANPNPTTEGGLYYAGSGVYSVWNGSAWVTVPLSSSGFWSRNVGGWLFPTTTTDGVTIGTSSNDGSGYLLQVNGGIEMIVADTSHNILSKGTNTFNAISAPSGGISAGFSSTDLSLIAGAFVGSQFEAITATSNASIGALSVVAGTTVNVSSGRSGTGTFLPMAFFTNGAESMRITTTDQVLAGFTSTDLSLTAGAFVGSQFEAITASTNASIAGLSVVAGSAVFISSGRSGTGTFLPMEFFVNGAERMRINTSGQLLVGRTTDDGSGATIEASGGISAGGSYFQNGNTGKSGTVNICSGVSGGNCTTTSQATFSGGILTGCAGAFSCF